MGLCMERAPFLKLRNLTVSSLFIFLCACGGGAGDETGNPDTPRPDPIEPVLTPGNKFTLISRTRVVADGLSELVAKIKVTDASGTPVPRYVMRLTSPKEDGVNYIRCDDSDSQGISMCGMRAHRDGTKVLTVVGTDKTLQVEFAPFKDNRAILFNVAPMAHFRAAAGPDTISVMAGPRYSVPRQEAGTDLIINDLSVSD